MKPWHEVYLLPEPGNMMNKGEGARDIFIRQGNSIFEAVSFAIFEHCGLIGKNQMILDFGCGNGRVALPFFYRFKKPTHCVDVDENVIGYLQKVIPGSNPLKTNYMPPLPYENNFFDCVYSISIWTHLPPELQFIWLQEVRRILKPGGIGLISTSGYRALKSRRQRRMQFWVDVSDEQLKSQGFIFHQASVPSGVTGTYGYAAHDPEWTKKNFGSILDVLETRECEIDGIQDLNILAKA